MDTSLYLNKKQVRSKVEFKISGSKSISNRLLILSALYPNQIETQNLSDAEDTLLLQKALNENSGFIDIHHAGTAMRFLTAFFACSEGREVLLTGSDRMKQRPVGILVDALNSMGAKIEYTEKNGYPPLKIAGTGQLKNTVELSAAVSSQYISALMLIAPQLKNGLNIKLTDKITSEPYIEMTAELLRKTGISLAVVQNEIRIKPLDKLKKMRFEVESDYSSLSYFFSLAALSEGSEFRIESFKPDSIQGDKAVAEIYNKYFGVESHFEENRIVIKKNANFRPVNFELNLNDTPDLAQTIAVSAAALKIKCRLNGLATLKIKETDRLTALYSELGKIGAKSIISSDSIELYDFSAPENSPSINTYNDHRMAMAFAPLRVFTDLEIENPKVVEKSYPNFWADFEKCFLD